MQRGEEKTERLRITENGRGRGKEKKKKKQENTDNHTVSILCLQNCVHLSILNVFSAGYKRKVQGEEQKSRENSHMKYYPLVF